MEIGNKIMELRKKEGLSQEELAEKVGVARQTISKWELGETSPDIKQAKELSKIFNVSLDELVGNDIKEILIEKTSNTEKLAGLILKTVRVMIILLVIFPFAYIILYVGVKYYREHSQGRYLEQSITCEIDGESYSYGYAYYEETGNFKEAGGDDYLYEEVDLGKYEDAYRAMNAIERYAKKNNGTCTRTEPEEVKK